MKGSLNTADERIDAAIEISSEDYMNEDLKSAVGNVARLNRVAHKLSDKDRDLTDQEVDEVMETLDTARKGFTYSAMTQQKYDESGEQQKSELAKMVSQELATAYRNSADVIFSDHSEAQERYVEQLNDPNIKGIEKAMKDYALRMGNVIETNK